MSITKETTIWCDGNEDLSFDCGAWERDAFTAAELRKELKKAGWKHIDGKDYCPSCAKKLKGENR